MSYKDNSENRAAKRSRITIDVTPELRRRIKLAAAQNDLSISEYLGRILDEAVLPETSAKKQERHPVTPEYVQRVLQVRERIIQESGGQLFEDSAERVRQMRDERTNYLEELREQR
ncbi:MAG TPA: hypothetical protein VKV20_00745 [Ktedonobacteraceae bacterium]|nr:hypothetical protein [Ktedonobacteraceae bacterium]